MIVVVAGSTGLCASSYVKACIDNPSVKQLWSFSRRDPGYTSDKLIQHTSPSEDWFKSLPKADIMFSGIATTAGAAGGFANQYKIDHDLQVELAKAAKAKGIGTFVLVSSAMASPTSWLPYLRMKGETERDIAAIGIPRLIILRPSLLLGRDHSQNFKGRGEAAASWVGRKIHRTWFQGVMKPIYGSEVATAATKILAKAEEGVHIYECDELLALSAQK